MVTPISLYGAGCAATVPMDRVDVNNSAANTAVFMDASLLSWIRLLTGDATRNAIIRRECAKDQPGGMRLSTFCPLSTRHERRAPLRTAADTRLRSVMSRTFARGRFLLSLFVSSARAEHCPFCCQDSQPGVRRSAPGPSNRNYPSS